MDGFNDTSASHWERGSLNLAVTVLCKINWTQVLNSSSRRGDNTQPMKATASPGNRTFSNFLLQLQVANSSKSSRWMELNPPTSIEGSTPPSFFLTLLTLLNFSQRRIALWSRPTNNQNLLLTPKFLNPITKPIRKVTTPLPNNTPTIQVTRLRRS